jgi:hypothetical protein
MEMIGLYIDADNISHKIVPELLSRIRKMGNLGIVKVYRDWSQIDSHKWIDIINTHKLEAIQCFRQPKKQSTDIYMITDLCNDLYTIPNLNNIVLATCDSDFTHLCHQILKLGKKLILIGKDNKLGSICHDFWYYNDLLLTPKKTNNTTVKEKNQQNLLNYTFENKHDIYELSSESGDDSDDYLSSVSEEEISVKKHISKQVNPIKKQVTNNELKNYLIQGMKQNYILLISELKKNLKEINTSNIETNWRKMETEIKKFPSDFLVVKIKSRINILYIPELLNSKFNEKQLEQILSQTYPDILKQIPLEHIVKLLATN